MIWNRLKAIDYLTIGVIIAFILPLVLIARKGHGQDWNTVVLKARVNGYSELRSEGQLQSITVEIATTVPYRQVVTVNLALGLQASQLISSCSMIGTQLSSNEQGVINGYYCLDTLKPCWYFKGYVYNGGVIIDHMLAQTGCS